MTKPTLPVIEHLGTGIAMLLEKDVGETTVSEKLAHVSLMDVDYSINPGYINPNSHQQYTPTVLNFYFHPTSNRAKTSASFVKLILK